jgi:hypothetical protein
LIIKEGLEPEALDEISLKVGESMEIWKKLILTSHRPKFWRSSSVADASIWIIVQQKLKISVKNTTIQQYS